MQNFRYRENKYTSNTTDDCSLLEKYKSNDDVLYLIKNVKDIWYILNETNKYICQCNTDFIIKNKPIFDEQKIILIKIDLLINNIVSNGLKKSLKDSQIKYNNKYLTTNTFSTEWNKLANIVNNSIHNIIDKNNQEYITIDMIHNTGNKDKIMTTNNNNKKYIFVILVILIIIVSIVYKIITHYLPINEYLKTVSYLY